MSNSVLRAIFVLGVATYSLACASGGSGATGTTTNDATAVARGFVDALTKDDFSRAMSFVAPDARSRADVSDRVRRHASDAKGCEIDQVVTRPAPGEPNLTQVTITWKGRCSGVYNVPGVDESRGFFVYLEVANGRFYVNVDRSTVNLFY